MPSSLLTTRSLLRASSKHSPSSSIKHLILPHTSRRPLTMSNPAHQPRPDFKVVEASRPEFDSSSQFRFTRSPNPTWSFGSGANGEHPTTPASHVAIDPYAEGRPPNFNYKLLISAIIPRPIAFVSTLSPDGKTQNLAPFSYFNFVNHDPPILVVGFASSVASAKDTLRNVLESKEAVINIISETFVEAANATAINAPYGVSEWDVAGLTPVYDCETVKAPRVKEAVFSVEVKLHSVTEFDSKSKPGQKSGTMCTFEGMRFWAREDAVNEERNILDPQVLRPISRLGGITYGRTTEGLEIPRPDFERDLGGKDGYDKLKKT